MNKLFYISEKVINQLEGNIVDNMSAYEGDGFADSAEELAWQIPLDDGKQYDLSALDALSTGEGSASEIENSLAVWRAMANLSPMLASEPRIWTRLSHVECFQYTKERWIKSDDDPDKKQKSIAKHFFCIGEDRLSRRPCNRKALVERIHSLCHEAIRSTNSAGTDFENC